MDADLHGRTLRRGTQLKLTRNVDDLTKKDFMDFSLLLKVVVGVSFSFLVVGYFFYWLVGDESVEQATLEPEKPVVPPAPMLVTEAELEESLLQLIRDPAHRPQFLRDLLSATILIPQLVERDRPDPVTTVRRIEVSFVNHAGNNWFPFFTSLQRLNEWRSETAYAKLKTREFFRLTRGSNLLLNPNAAASMEFRPNEIAEFLSDEVSVSSRPIAPIGTEVLMGMTRADSTLIDLGEMFAKHPQIQAAYVAYKFSSIGVPPSLLFVIEGEGNLQPILKEAIDFVLVMHEKMSFNFTSLGSQSKYIQDFFRKGTQPFYKKD